MKQLLFVDDEIRVLDGLRRMLRAKRDEWECHFAGGVTEAFEIIRGVSVDAIVSDINMPETNGLEFLDMLKANHETRFIPVLMLTGNGEVNVKRQALTLGATDFLNKPFDFVELIARLQNAMSLKEFQDEIRRQNILLEERVEDRTRDLEVSRKDIIFRLAKAAEARDVNTGHHIIRVGVISQMLAAKLGFDERFQEQMLLTAPLHDVGKIAVSDTILQKAGPLSDLERERMKEHCEVGAKLLTEDLSLIFDKMGAALVTSPSKNDLLQIAAKIAMHHHEHWDGNGYPEGINGEQIPVEARIVAVADVYDALRSNRPYKRGFTAEQTWEIISGASGAQFDPAIVNALGEIQEKIEERLAPLRDVELHIAA